MPKRRPHGPGASAHSDITSDVRHGRSGLKFLARTIADLIQMCKRFLDEFSSQFIKGSISVWLWGRVVEATGPGLPIKHARKRVAFEPGRLLAVSTPCTQGRVTSGPRP